MTPLTKILKGIFKSKGKWYQMEVCECKEVCECEEQEKKWLYE